MVLAFALQPGMSPTFRLRPNMGGHATCSQCSATMASQDSSIIKLQFGRLGCAGTLLHIPVVHSKRALSSGESPFKLFGTQGDTKGNHISRDGGETMGCETSPAPMMSARGKGHGAGQLGKQIEVGGVHVKLQGGRMGLWRAMKPNYLMTMGISCVH